MIRTTVPPCLQEAFDLLPLVTSVTGGPGPVLSRTAQEWYQPHPDTGRFQHRASLSGCALRPLLRQSFFQVVLYHQLFPLSTGNRRENPVIVPLFFRKDGKKKKKSKKTLDKRGDTLYNAICVQRQQGPTGRNSCRECFQREYF